MTIDKSKIERASRRPRSRAFIIAREAATDRIIIQSLNQRLINSGCTHKKEPAFNFGVFCLAKKADSTLLLRVGTWTTSRRFGLSNDLNAVNGLEPSNASCR